MRQYGEVPPVLSTDPAPRVESTAGLGTGGGAGVQTPDGSGFGGISIMTGSSPLANGNVQVGFSASPPALFISLPDDFGTQTIVQAGSELTIAWSGATLLPNHRYRIHYEWSISQ